MPPSLGRCGTAGGTRGRLGINRGLFGVDFDPIITRAVCIDIFGDGGGNWRPPPPPHGDVCVDVDGSDVNAAAPPPAVAEDVVDVEDDVFEPYLYGPDAEAFVTEDDG